MTTAPTPLPPLAEVLNKKADEATPLELAMSAYDTAADLAAPYDAERARLRDERAKYRNLAGQALCMIADLEDEEFRAECMARLGKDSKALIEDAATLIMQLAETIQEATP